MTTHDDSLPPSPPASPPMRAAGRPVLPSVPSEPTAERALRVALEGRDEAREVREDVASLRESIGTPPNPTTGATAKPGTMWHAIVTMGTDLGAKIDALAAAVREDRAAAAREREAQARVDSALAQRREPLSRAAWLLLAAIFGLVTVLGGKVLDRVWPLPAAQASQQPR